MDGGPNAGLFYVASARFYMRRESNLNPQALPGGTPLPLSGTQAAQCGSSANFYTFNRCMGVNVDGMLAAAWQHEGFGSHGDNGHESVAQAYATDGIYGDPMAAVDGMVSIPGETLDQFSSGVRSLIWSRSDYITTNSSDASGHVTGNWSGSAWLWNGSGFVQGTFSF